MSGSALWPPQLPAVLQAGERVTRQWPSRKGPGEVSCFKRQVSAKEGENLPGRENMILVLPNYYNFEITGLSGKGMEKGKPFFY